MVKSRATQEYLTDKIGSRHTWIGLSDLNQEGKYEFVDGSMASMTFWSPMTNANAEGRDCVYSYSRMESHNHGLWADGTCSTHLSFLCQKSKLWLGEGLKEIEIEREKERERK